MVNKFSRRQVLRRAAVTLGLPLEKIVETSTVLAALLSSSCATLKFREEGPIIYPTLSGKKIQPPDSGCYVGFNGCWERKSGDWAIWKDDRSDLIASVYEDQMGHKPAMLSRLLIFSDQIFGYSWNFMENADKEGIIPFTYLSLLSPINLYGSLKKLENNREFTESVKTIAESVADRKMPHFVCTMPELNGGWAKWGKRSKVAKEIWRHMWQVYEDSGANEYATWVWEVYTPISSSTRIGSPERYYPGDKYVDWIGLSSYARRKIPITNKSFKSLVGSTYSSMRKNHPSKPIMMAEYGKTWDKNQARWLDRSFETIKSWPGMKAIMYWNNINYSIKDDHSLNPESRKIFQKHMDQGYFLSAKKK